MSSHSETLYHHLSHALQTSQAFLGPFLLVSINVILIFLILLACSSYGRIRMGGAKSKARFGFASWIAMLFAAGMGSGLMFWGVAEPVMHAANAPILHKNIHVNALSWSYIHWGFHAWAIYALAAIAIGLSVYNMSQPARISSVFEASLPHALPSKTKKAFYICIDGFTIIAIIMGVSASLGMASLQLYAGLESLPLQTHEWFTPSRVLLTLSVCFLFSAALPLAKGIQTLSYANIALACAFLLLCILSSDLWGIYSLFTSALLSSLAELYTHTSITLLNEHTEWMQSWTVNYFFWWAAWAPFVGLFIARISYGRTLRQIIVSILLVPCLFSFVWFTVLGNMAFTQMELSPQLSAAIIASPESANYLVLNIFHEYKVMVACVIWLLMAIFLITSADSASYVLAMQTSGGNTHPSARSKVVWGACLSISALAALHLEEGVSVMRMLGFAGGVPFSVILVFFMPLVWIMCRKLAVNNKESL